MNEGGSYLERIKPGEHFNPGEVFGLDEYKNWNAERKTPEGRIKKAMEIAMASGGNDESHHQAWAMDQMVRALTGCPVVFKRNTSIIPKPIVVAALGESEEYLKFIKEHNAGDDGPDTYSWDVGIAP